MDFVNALVSMASAHTSLELLRLSLSTGVADRRAAIRWPLDSWRKLTELTLSDLVKFGCPSSYELGNTLANCPGLHALRMNDIDPVWEQDREHSTIHLPSLRLFVTSDQPKPGLLHLLTLMKFGDQSLDFRLFSRALSPRSEIESLMTRSNVEALTINSTKRVRIKVLKSYLLCVPRLRVLLISSQNSPAWGLGRLATLTDFDLPKHLPLLRWVCLMDGFIKPTYLARTQAFLANNAIRDLAFIGCDFFYPTNTSDTGIQANDRDEDSDSDSDEENDLIDGIYPDCVTEVCRSSGPYPMAESTRVELLQTFERVLVLDARPGCIHKGEDTFIRALVNAE
ncbi:F-box-like protein [Ceratobasidium sp. AG-Ba]|nr:F-box-like protein [Ceratobasidium sp. AG-Ba]